MGRGWQSGVTASATALSTAAYPLRMPRRTQRRVLRCRVTNPIKEALTALADVLAKRPAEEILFEWFRSGRLVGELSVRITLHEPTTVSHLIDRPIHLVDWMAGSCLPPGSPRALPFFVKIARGPALGNALMQRELLLEPCSDGMIHQIRGRSCDEQMSLGR